MNNWTEIKIEVNSADIDKAGDIANVVVPYGIYIEDYTNLEQTVEDIAHIDLIDEDLLKKDRSKPRIWKFKVSAKLFFEISDTYFIIDSEVLSMTDFCPLYDTSI